MATQTYIPLANITLSSAAASVTFSGINQGYRDLIVVSEAKSTGTGSALRIVFNGVTTLALYDAYQLGATGTTATSGYSTGNGNVLLGGFYSLDSSTASMMATAQIMDYSATDKAKLVLVESGGSANSLDLISNRFNSISAITSLSISHVSGITMAAGSTFTLYGVL